MTHIHVHGDNALTLTYVTTRSRWLSGRASHSGAGGRWLESRSRNTKEFKMVSVATLLGAQPYMASTGFSSHNKYMHNLHRNTYKKKISNYQCLYSPEGRMEDWQSC